MGKKATRYTNPPIVEAAISVGYPPVDVARLPEMRDFAAALKSEYPHQSPRLQHQAQLQFGQTVGYTSSQHEDGVICASEDRRRFAQFSLTAVIFSRLAPYGSWEDFEHQARPLWERFYEAFSVQPSSLAVRYINRIEIPTGEPMENYLRTFPEISRDLPQMIGRYFMRIEMPIEDAVLVMQQGFVPASSPELYGILLDNDLRYEVSTAESLWQMALKARSAKDQIFEACITDKLRERFN